ncbi:MAG TPA: hypothetical protein VE988_29280 [Gemmataceae bacterium]|nr:hypothetical protein [Gemmataceae bacterium]
MANRRVRKPYSLVCCIAAAIWLLFVQLPTAHAGFLSAGADQFAVLGQFSSSVQTNYNNGTITGNVGIGSDRDFTISNASLIGNLRFSGNSSYSGISGPPPSGPFTVSGGGAFTGSIITNDSVVSAALNAMNSLSQTLGGEAGTSTTITNGGSINAANGVLDASGNRVFTASVNFANGIFTVNGSASDYVVLNIGSNANLHGQILLAGGITSDHVLINVFGGNYTTHTGGPSLDVNTNGLQTFGIFLDPNGQMSANETDIQGRFFGGSANHNQQIVSGFNITAPLSPPDVSGVPAPPAFLLAMSGLLPLGLAALRRWRRQLMGSFS